MARTTWCIGAILAPVWALAPPDLVVVGKVIMDDLREHPAASPALGGGAPQAAWGARALSPPRDVGVVAPVGEDAVARARRELRGIGADARGLAVLPAGWPTPAEEIWYADADGGGGGWRAKPGTWARFDEACDRDELAALPRAYAGAGLLHVLLEAANNGSDWARALEAALPPRKLQAAYIHVYQFADPWQCLNVMYQRDAGQRSWHFDGSDFVVTLKLQNADEG